MMHDFSSLFRIKSVSVTYDTGSTACIAAGNAIRITFLSPHGNVPSISISNSKLIYPTGTVSTSVVETIQGTKEDGTCNNRGRCGKWCSSTVDIMLLSKLILIDWNK
jgi:hypothetical protein